MMVQYITQMLIAGAISIPIGRNMCDNINIQYET
jgi:hypothetical protein